MPNPTPQQPSVAEPMTEGPLGQPVIELPETSELGIIARKRIAERDAIIDRLRAENARLVEELKARRPCQHPARIKHGRHEWYIGVIDDTGVCRACGADYSLTLSVRCTCATGGGGTDRLCPMHGGDAALSPAKEGG